MSAGALEITWLKDGQILFREIAHGVPRDSAIVGAWLDLPRIASMTGGEPDRIEFHDPATGRTIVEHVPQPVHASGFAVLAPYFLIGMAVLIVLVWLSGHGYKGEAGMIFGHVLGVVPELAIGAIAAFLWARQRDRNARRRWAGTPEGKA